MHKADAYPGILALARGSDMTCPWEMSLQGLLASHLVAETLRTAGALAWGPAPSPGPPSPTASCSLLSAPSAPGPRQAWPVSEETD